ncbi:MAG: hypothetical protein PHR68_01705 [Candidatus Gracilibacteria bacterium]|nr:hypothetical protein [Candidatus Gracilibacteria bacterium]
MNKDIIKSFRKKKMINNFSIIALSLAFAISINFALSDSKIGNYLKTSIQDAQNNEINKSDLYMEVVKSGPNNEIKIKSSKDIFQVTNLAFSFFYNNENIKIKDILTSLDQVELNKMVDYEGTKTINLVFKKTGNIKAGDIIASIFLEKTSTNLENLNLINTNFTDKDNNIYYLNSSSVEF